MVGKAKLHTVDSSASSLSPQDILSCFSSVQAVDSTGEGKGKALEPDGLDLSPRCALNICVILGRVCYGVQLLMYAGIPV